MRIVGGRLKGKPLVAPDGMSTRPTGARARESVFNILEHQDFGRRALRGGVILDGFAGSGALGLEALSRGAEQAVFMDRDEAAIRTIRQNVKTCQVTNQSDIVRADILNPPKAIQPVDLVFLDPPYQESVIADSLLALRGSAWIKSGTLCVVEVSKKNHWEPESGFEILDKRTYGAAKILFLLACGSFAD